MQFIAWRHRPMCNLTRFLPSISRKFSQRLTKSEGNLVHMRNKQAHLWANYVTQILVKYYARSRAYWAFKFCACDFNLMRM